MSNKVKNIVDLLPEGLSKEAINEIASLVNTVIEEEVDTQVKDLNSKVFAYLRIHIDEVKEHALKELHEENETYRNAKLFEELKTFMTLEMSKEDEDSAVSKVVQESTQTQEEVDVLVEELNKSLSENDKLETTLTAISSNVESLKKEKELLERKVVSLTESLDEAQEEPFKSSEKAVVIAENITQQQRTLSADNEFLTKDVMKFMPFNSTKE